MTMPVVTGVPSVGLYEPILGYLHKVLATLPPVERTSSFPGGLVLRISADYFVTILLPPCGAAMRRMGEHFGEHYDNWLVKAHEFHDGPLEVLHMTIP